MVRKSSYAVRVRVVASGHRTKNSTVAKGRLSVVLPADCRYLNLFPPAYTSYFIEC
jgi:hypothetical protein